jgi:hypothetical protein
LSNYALGKDYLNHASLEKYCNSNNFIGFIALEENKVIGFTLIDILSPAELKNTVLKDNDWFYNLVKLYQKIALIKQTVVNRKFNNKGIGSKLVEFSNKELISKFDIQLSTVWKKENGNAMSNILMENGFSLLKTITNYWKKDSLINLYDCPVCRNPCKCSTEVYIKKKH